MDWQTKSFFCTVISFTTGVDVYFPRVLNIRWYQSLVDFSFGERHKTRLQRLLWALAHSFDLEDVQCAVILLQGLLLTNNPWEKKEMMYLLAFVYYRSGYYLKSLDLVNHCLEITPRCMDSIYLKSRLETCIKEDRARTMLSVASKIVGVGVGVGLTSLFSSTWVIEAIRAFKDRLKKSVDAATLTDTRNPSQIKEEIYLLAQRYCKRGNYSRARFVIECCLEIDPAWEPALILKKSIESNWCPDLHYI